MAKLATCCLTRHLDFFAQQIFVAANIHEIKKENLMSETMAERLPHYCSTAVLSTMCALCTHLQAQVCHLILVTVPSEPYGLYI